MSNIPLSADAYNKKNISGSIGISLRTFLGQFLAHTLFVYVKLCFPYLEKGGI